MAKGKGIREMLAAAEAVIETIPAEKALALRNDPDVLFVDLRDPRELERDGMIPGAFHAPRGMLEFWIDPESPYHKPIFAEGRKYVFYCASGWRSALATRTAREMGLERAAHIGGGFKAWAAAGGEVASPKPRRAGA